MNKFNFASDSIHVKKTLRMGLGVFTRTALRKNKVIEIAPVIVMTKADRGYLDLTLLHDYIFEWGDDHQECCMALGYVPLYNHSYTANCEYEMDFVQRIITIRTVRSIQAGEELFINYNGDWNNSKPIWFDAK